MSCGPTVVATETRIPRSGTPDSELTGRLPAPSGSLPASPTLRTVTTTTMMIVMIARTAGRAI
ncbi:hypothetical protein BHE74_00020022 [Ensete ventricosum]|nr:hypothetical protein GW17_00056037 [Ensete ventricosum]RWW72199.1 hypothetical protein BHE74_00020022 [Ensete ventricosum]RZR84078.1 hypothetical protein BHM03_00010805 [Ensete ventricosum]